MICSALCSKTYYKNDLLLPSFNYLKTIVELIIFVGGR